VADHDPIQVNFKFGPLHWSQECKLSCILDGDGEYYAQYAQKEVDFKAYCQLWQELHPGEEFHIFRTKLPSELKRPDGTFVSNPIHRLLHKRYSKTKFCLGSFMYATYDAKAKTLTLTHIYDFPLGIFEQK
jgi:hypothetical protein